MKSFRKSAMALVFAWVAVATGAVPADPRPEAAAAQVKFPRGHKTPADGVLAARHAQAFQRHGHRNQALPTAVPVTFDCRTMGWVGSVQNQGNCGSCWDVSATGVITNAYIKAGRAKADGSFVLSPQYVLDGCGGPNGGCDGDDAPTVLDMAKTKGLPLESEYGPYTASPGPCKYTAQTLYTISDWGYCTPAQSKGVASTQDIKNCMVRYGPLSTAVVADSSWDNYTGGVMPFTRSAPRFVDHDVSIIGWDDGKVVPGTGTRGAWLVLNQWGSAWGEKGCCWIGYGSAQIGTEAAFVSVAALPPPPPPPPPDPVTGAITFTPADFSPTGVAKMKALGLESWTFRPLKP